MGETEKTKIIRLDDKRKELKRKEEARLFAQILELVKDYK